MADIHDREESFSDLAYRYFDTRGTYPLLLTRKTHNTDEESLEDFRNKLFSEFNGLCGVDVIETQIVEDEYWSGVLVELSGDTYIEMKNDTPQGEANCLNLASDIHREWVESSHEQMTGFSCGSSDVSAASSLQDLGAEFFL